MSNNEAPASFVQQQDDEQPILTIKRNDGAVMVEVCGDGTHFFGEAYTPTEGARAFWEAVSSTTPTLVQLRKQERAESLAERARSQAQAETRLSIETLRAVLATLTGDTANAGLRREVEAKLLKLVAKIST